MKTEHYAIGLDTGSTNIKGVLVDSAGSIRGKATMPCQYTYPQEGWVEYDIELFYPLICQTIRELVDQAPGPVASLCISGATGNTLLLDNDLEPLHPAISWMDQRKIEPLFSKEEVYPVVG